METFDISFKMDKEARKLDLLKNFHCAVIAVMMSRIQNLVTMHKTSVHGNTSKKLSFFFDFRK